MIQAGLTGGSATTQRPSGSPWLQNWFLQSNYGSIWDPSTSYEKPSDYLTVIERESIDLPGLGQGGYPTYTPPTYTAPKAPMNLESLAWLILGLS